MTTRFLILILACAMGAQAQTAKTHTYHIIPGIRIRQSGDQMAWSADGEECTHPPSVVQGRDRDDALINAGINPASGITVSVFDEAEWAAYEKNVAPIIDAGCKRATPVVSAPIPDYGMVKICDKNSNATDCLALVPEITVTTTDPHGCSLGGSWDEGRRMCTIHITFTGIAGAVSCSPVAADTYGSQHIICWYKPKRDAQLGNGGYGK